LRSVVGQTMKLVEFTPNVDALLTAIATLNARPGTPDGGQLLEGISEAALELQKAEAKRPIIIALTVGGQEHSTVSSDLVLDQLRKSGAALHVFSVANSALRSTVAAQKPRDLLQENMHLYRVLGDGPEKGQANHARFDNAEYNRLFRLQRTLPDGPERMQIMTRMKEILVAYMPYKAHVHRIWTDLAQPWVVGYHRNVFMREFWRYVDVDPAEKARRTK